jgi:MFS family permease
MISLSSPPQSWGEAFGVHRSLDTVGALLGPLVAFIVLSQTPDQYDVVFVVAFCFAIVGVAVIGLFVREPSVSTDEPPARAMWSESRTLLQRPEFRRLVVMAGALSLLTISEPFVYLVIQDASDMGVRWFPLLFAGTAIAYVGLAVPAGRLADRVGRTTVFIGAFGLLVVAYALLLFSDLGLIQVLLILGLLGAFAAGTDGVLMAAAAPMLADGRRATGLALITSTTALARFASSVVFGAVWLAWGWRAAVGTFAVGLLVVVLQARARLTDSGPK